MSVSYLIKDLWKKEDEHLKRIIPGHWRIRGRLWWDVSVPKAPSKAEDYLLFLPFKGEGHSWHQMQDFISELYELHSEFFKYELTMMPLSDFYTDAYGEYSIIHIPFRWLDVPLTWEVLEKMDEIAKLHRYYIY